MASVERNVLLDRIQGLLNKTIQNGATEAEAASAMAAARRLMDQHNIALAEVVAHDADATTFGNEVGWEGKSENAFYEAAARIVAEAFAVRTMTLRTSTPPMPKFGIRRRRSKVEIILVGDPTNLATAK